MARKRRGSRLKSEMNVVPYIDVMLVLLVIFMISAPLLNQSVEVALPHASIAKEIQLDEQRRPIIISIDKNDNYYIDRANNSNTPVDLASMKNYVANAIATDRELPVYIRADKGTEYSTIVNLIDVLDKQSVPSVKLVMSE